MAKNNPQDKTLGEDGLVIRINKEEEKRLRAEIRDFAKNLLSLPTAKYADLPIDSLLHKALIEGKRLTPQALKRHLSFLIKLIHDQNYQAIQDAYNKAHHPYRHDPAKIKQTEAYRDRLVSDDKTVIDELTEKFINVDIQLIRQLARNAKNEQKKIQSLTIDEQDDTNKHLAPSKSTKRLYQYLSSLTLQ